MFRSKKILLGIMATLLIVLPTMLSAASEAGLIYLLIEPGSRAGAMGQAYTAQAEDGFATYWNPGATAFNRSTKAGWMHTNWLGDASGIDDMYYEYLTAYTYLEDIGNVGFTISFFNYGEQEITSQQGDDLGTFDSNELCVGVTYGYQLTRNIGIGTNVKFLYSNLVPQNKVQDNNDSNNNGDAISFAFDFGLKWRDIGYGEFVIPGLDFGVNLQNLGPAVTYNDKEQEDPLPLNIRAGLSYRVIEEKLTRLVINADVTQELSKRGENPLTRVVTGIVDNSDLAVYAIGAEFTYMDLLDLRGGYHYDKEGSIEGYSFGAGVHYTFYNRYFTSFDFAFQPAGDLTDYNKTFSVSFYF